ncbi:putative protein kinase-like domain superfamily [Helianthus annuus]|nr:putative protein kinase-like domain superfamily [Helianthus annuus]KAJ0627626.1 putative protein kinase-like domain superfamily [Helianthus annuus]KAJ0783925.1 putative protein kinase-like domain superfamily [Helianthus annuus]
MDEILRLETLKVDLMKKVDAEVRHNSILKEELLSKKDASGDRRLALAQEIGDLGLSKVKQHTMVPGGVRGTLPWMAPELLSGKSHMVTEKVYYIFYIKSNFILFVNAYIGMLNGPCLRVAAKSWI